MGGNAINKLNDIKSVRIDKDTYEIVCEQLIDIFERLRERLGSFEYKIVKTFDDKQDFGDIDILLKGDSKFDRDLFEHLFNIWSNDEQYGKVKNGPVTSFVYLVATGHFQVDINYVPLDESLDMAYEYHGNGDLGNLVGRIFHNLGVKFGHNGLWYIHRNENYVVGEILLCDDIEKIFNSIGLNYNKNHTFKNEHEIFDFVISSPFFHPDFYQLELRNHTARVRDKKRPSYTRFVEYINSKTFREKPLSSKSYHTVLIEQFDAMDKYIELVEKESNRMYNKAICDSLFVKEVSGLDGTKLGELMQDIKTRCKFSKSVPFHVNREHLKKFILSWKIVRCTT